MTAVSEAKTTHQPVNTAKKTPSFNIYPVLGVLLLILLAAAVYGGLFMFVLDA